VCSPRRHVLYALVGSGDNSFGHIPSRTTASWLSQWTRSVIKHGST
jgi:hypothetical protein